MAESNPVIEVRRACLEDFQAVMDINRNVYMGLDYIPFYYETLVTDPTFSFYVCLVDGEVGAFEGVCLLDNDNTLMTRAARVKEKFQGQGLMAHIRKRIYEDYKDLPGEKRLRCSCTDLVHYVHSKKFQSQNKTLLVERIVQFETVDVRQMSPVTGDFEDAKPITFEQFSHLLQNDIVKNYLFPHNLITAVSWFYDALPVNIKHLKKVSSCVIITKPLYECLPSSTTQTIGNSNSDTICKTKLKTTKDEGTNSGPSSSKADNPIKNDCIHGLLGVVCHYFTPTHLLLSTNLFGRPAKGNEVEEIRSILKHTYSFLHELYQDRSKFQTVFIAVVVSQEIPEEFVLEAAKPFGFVKSTSDPLYTEQWYFEQDFEFLLG